MKFSHIPTHITKIEGSIKGSVFVLHKKRDYPVKDNLLPHKGLNMPEERLELSRPCEH